MVVAVGVVGVVVVVRVWVGSRGGCGSFGVIVGLCRCSWVVRSWGFGVVVGCVVVAVGDVVVAGVVVFVVVVFYGGRVLPGVCGVRAVGCCVATSLVL